MRVNGALAAALYSSATLLGQVRAADNDDAVESSSTVAESSTTSAIERPTFTVRRPHHLKTKLLISTDFWESLSRASKAISSNNSQMTGRLDGSLHMQRKKTQKLTRNGHSLGSGPSKNLMF